MRIPNRDRKNEMFAQAVQGFSSTMILLQIKNCNGERWMSVKPGTVHTSNSDNGAKLTKHDGFSRRGLES